MGLKVFCATVNAIFSKFQNEKKFYHFYQTDDGEFLPINCLILNYQTPLLI